MDLSVIIVNWNTKKLLEDCLRSIFKFTKDVGFEIIIVDNGSEDGSQAMVEKKFPQVKLIPNEDNLGFAKANNQGIKIAKVEYVLLLNSDTYLIENSFKKLVEKVDKFDDFGALGPLLLNEDRSIQQSVGYFPDLPQIFWWMTFIDDLSGGTMLKPYHVDHDSFYKSEHEVDWVTGAAFFIPTKVIYKVGLLDEKIFMYGEDFEWCFRIKKSGFKVYFSPVAKIVHIGGGSVNKVRTNAFVGEFRGLVYFYKKYKSHASLQILLFLLKMGTLLRIAAFAIFGRIKTAKSYVEVLKMAG